MNKTKRKGIFNRLAVCAVSLTTLASATACGKPANVGGKVAVICKNENVSFWDEVKTGATDCCDEMGYELLYYCASSDTDFASQVEYINDAIDKVVSGDRDQYIDFLVSIVKAQGLSKGTISLSQSDQALSAKLSDKLSKEIPGSAFEIAAEPANIKGGLICTAGTTSYNASIEAIAEDIRGDIGAEVAEVLFGTQEN